jgi:hypothetical protein
MPIDPSRDWLELISYLPPETERLAFEMKLLKTQWKNAKVRTAADLLRFFFVHAGAGLGLRPTVALVAAGGGPELSHVSLHDKLRAAGPWLGELITRMTSGPTAASANAELWDGYELVAVDGSTVSGPGAERADARLHVAMRIADLRPLEANVTAASEGETLRNFTWMPGQLVIADRGYANPPGVASTVEKGADVLVRVNRGALPLYDADAAIDVLEWLRGLPGHRTCERYAEVRAHSGAGRRRIRGRLIAVRLPAPKAAEARERVRKEFGNQATPEHFEAAEYVVLFTTAPASRLSSAQCIEAYRLRWQIELLFKRWKSICHLDELPNHREDTILSWVRTKVLLALILDRMGKRLASASAEVSPPKRHAAGLPARRVRAASGQPRLGAHGHLLEAHRRSHPAHPAL